ncbi:MAG TPA: tetratricopeptide repeat protein [Verrucomicrobiae bacterium]|jgi:tetratricopeptide (TPR) repeat protein|nr:tetratricopeptide repeat protein [Verrucomicrobiae bacterium]
MALGFGFNKTKILSAAEKYVQQGKLQNAIAEYEKVIKEDPKDLTVLNTIGDLYVRVGQNDQACGYFKKVGDQYAQNGFTVKAIAIYKKLTKLTPSAADLARLAELYTQQGLFNDARAQYMQVADQMLRAGDNAPAAKVFQKILELDPENAATQSKLADLYIKLGKKEEARKIYLSASEALYARKAFDAADDALSHVLSLDPGNSGAYLLRGMIASESGKAKAAVEYLDKVPDLDSRPDALRAMLRAKLQLGNVEGVEAFATKLIGVHNDTSGVTMLAEWYLANDHVESALKLYDRYADRFLAGGRAALDETLYPAINRIRDNADALNMMLRLLRKAGATSHVTEVMEMLAHTYVQENRFEDARDLYQELAELEPENPLHNQNYKQMTARLGEDSLARPLGREEGQQALMMEELEQAAPVVQQTYDSTVEKAIEAALTDAELFVSYNVASKAIAPLEDVLPQAPRDVRLNQRLATLYIKAERFLDAARVCRILGEVFAEFGHNEEARKYARAARDYEVRGGGTPLPETDEPAMAAYAEREANLEPIEVPDQLSAVEEQPAIAPFAQTDESLAEAPSPVAETGLTPDGTGVAHEIDLSSEWESMVSDEPVSGTSPVEAVVAPPAKPQETVAEAAPVDQATVIADKIQEARFYIENSMWEEAKSAVLDLTEMAPDSEEITALISEVSAARSRAIAPPEPAPPEPAPPAPPVIKEPPARVPAVPPVKAASPPPPAPPVEAEPEFVVDVVAPPEPAPSKPAPLKPVPPAAPLIKHPPARVPAAEPVKAATPPPRPPTPVPHVEAEPEFVLDLGSEAKADSIVELPLDQITLPPAKPAAGSVPVTRAKPADVPAPEKQLAGKSTEDILSDFVLDLEGSLGDLAETQFQQKPESRPQSPSPQQSVASRNGEMQDAESVSVLSDILADLQDDEADVAAAQGDPETHYNLGIAFKEMGLLDEAIGELQKVCHAVDHGSTFSQPIQAYTWLAQCLVDKGVPEAAVRWYERALHLPGLDEGSRCSIYYDLAAAYEASGDSKSALSNFMEVYSSNIDFRDVANRIKTLKS